MSETISFHPLLSTSQIERSRRGREREKARERLICLRRCRQYRTDSAPNIECIELYIKFEGKGATTSNINNNKTRRIYDRQAYRYLYASGVKRVSFYSFFFFCVNILNTHLAADTTVNNRHNDNIIFTVLLFFSYTPGLLLT